MKKYLFKNIVVGEEGLLKGPFGSDLKRSLYVPKSNDTFKVYLQENILQKDNSVGKHYISAQYYDEKMSRYAIKEGDFIVTCDGTLGEIFQLKNIQEKGIISSSLLRITLNNELVDDDFFYYYWEAIIKKKLIVKGNNSVLKHLPGLGEIRNLEIELPDIEIQKKIGTVLTKIDSKISNNTDICTTLESMAKLLYDYWFIQFDFPDENGKPYKSSGGKMVWNEELKREIPEGWGVKTIGSLLGNYPKTSSVLRDDYSKGSKYPIIDQSKDYICGYTDEEEKVIHTDNIIVFGDHTNIAKYINFDFARGADGTQIINSNDARLPNYILYLQICSLPIIEKGYSRHFKFLKEQRVVIPNQVIAEKYMIILNPTLFEIRRLIEENKQLTSLRDFLLPMLMNGQVKVGKGDE